MTTLWPMAAPCGTSERALGRCVATFADVAELAANMNHLQAAEHLREEVMNTARRETGPLVELEPTAFFGAVRGVMCDLDYVAALHGGFHGVNIRQVATRAKMTRFLEEVVAQASGNDGYRHFAPHLYEMYRVGLVHLRAPKIVHSDSASTPFLTWSFTPSKGKHPAHLGGYWVNLEHLRPHKIDERVTTLPVSVPTLFDDFLASCELFAHILEDEERQGGSDLICRWRSTADALVEAEPTGLAW
jgi:hypothetical protein